MFVERSEATEQIQNLAAAACTELMQAYGITLSRAEHWSESEEVLLSGVMGFVGEHVRGTCLLAAPKATVQATAPEAARPRDWVGELANQLVGRLKSKLMARGATIGLSTPVVLSGLKLSPMPRTSVEPVMFNTETGPVMVWLEVELQDEFVLGDERALPASEGDFLVF